MGVNHRGGEGEQVLPEFVVEDSNANYPLDFQEIVLRIHQNASSKWKIKNIIMGRGFAP